MELRFDISGMTCAACSARVEKVTGQITGVTKVEVNLLAGKMLVEADNIAVADEIISAVKRAGYGANLSGEKKVQAPDKTFVLREMKIRWIGSAVCLIKMKITLPRNLHW